jgi:hypothetical protein
MGIFRQWTYQLNDLHDQVWFAFKGSTVIPTIFYNFTRIGTVRYRTYTLANSRTGQNIG